MGSHVSSSYTEQITNELARSDLRVEHMVGSTVKSYKTESLMPLYLRSECRECRRCYQGLEVASRRLGQIPNFYRKFVLVAPLELLMELTKFFTLPNIRIVSKMYSIIENIVTK